MSEHAQKLNPCPFCGQPAATKTSGDWYAAGCTTYMAPGVLCYGQAIALQYRSEAEAIAAWNHRAPSEAEPAPRQAPSPVESMFYVQDTRQFVGNCVMWWGKNRSGYVTRLNEAGKYTLDEATSICERDTDRMWPCEQIDALAHPTVDMQHLPKPLQYRTKCAGVAYSLNKKDRA
ncbi:Lar family restriction alleviation protein [Cupriavidus basilensis]|nr:Lar family restriction alleviation protein [Cupriavidus basilensis]